MLLGLNSEQSMRKIHTFFYLIPKKGIMTLQTSRLKRANKQL
jgi:hypothetical protein